MSIGRNSCTIFSLRINNRNTCISINNKILAFYCAIVHVDKIHIHDFLQDKMSEFASQYTKDNFKGLSSFVLNRILMDMLRKKDIKKYKDHLSRLED